MGRGLGGIVPRKGSGGSSKGLGRGHDGDNRDTCGCNPLLTSDGEDSKEDDSDDEME